MLKKFILIGAMSLCALTAAPASFAQTVELGRDGIRIIEPDSMNRRDNRDRNQRDEISERQAVRIARSEGVRTVDDVRRTRSRYVIQGLDRRGNDIEVSIDRRSGNVLSVN
ncbi:PepSY domain-containing protein [Pararhizobium sp. PWRC1-1]|uniref:PepSY domain-containing protein n=1 Tax=Pararhizobium sp. PWRC1-1 TaxID=2804566 RepID=UPI003CEF459F